MENKDISIQDLAKKLFDEGRYSELIELGQQKKDDIHVQCQIIKLYIKSGDYNKIKKMQDRYKDEVSIQFQVARMYFNNRKYNETIEICNQFPDDNIMMSLLFKVYLECKNFDKINEISEKNPYNEQIQSQMIKLFYQRGQYNKVIEIGNRFLNNERIQNQIVKFYIEQKRYDKAISIGKRFPKFDPIQSMLLKVYIITKNIEEITRIKENFPNNEKIQNEIKEASYIFEKGNKNYSSDITHELGIIRTKLHLCKIESVDIEKLNTLKDKISKEDYYVALAAIYEKLFGKEKAIKILKDNFKENRQINKIIETIKSSKCFDLAKYDFFIKWPIDVEYQSTFHQSEVRRQITTEIINNPKSKKKKNKPQIISGTIGISKKEKNKIKEKQDKEYSVYDILTYEEKEKVLRIKLLLYLNMYEEDDIRKKAIKKYDILTSYLESDSNNNRALSIIHRIIENDYPKIPEHIKAKKLV